MFILLSCLLPLCECNQCQLMKCVLVFVCGVVCVVAFVCTSGTEMMDTQLLCEFEADVRDLESDSWSVTVDKKQLKQLKKEVVKRQDVIYGRLGPQARNITITVFFQYRRSLMVVSIRAGKLARACPYLLWHCKINKCFQVHRAKQGV